jgi:LysR family glycine cleavage system transcriptional activator
MRRRLPPLNALRAFEAAARHQSFSSAARELGVAHSAVGRHVANLEGRLGVLLFEREQHRLKLTPQGAAYAMRLKVLFDQIQDATASCVGMREDQTPLRVAVHPTFAIRLLIPQLAHFQKQFPDVTVQIESSHASVDPGSSSVDVSVLLGAGSWPDLDAEFLFEEELLPVGSPLLLRGQSFKSADEIKPFLLLHAARRQDEWPKWLRGNGIADMTGYRELSLDYSGLVLEGAINGLGLALAQSQYIRNELDGERLVPLFKATLKTGRAYYLVCPSGRAAEPKIREFRCWLKSIVA